MLAGFRYAIPAYVLFMGAEEIQALSSFGPFYKVLTTILTLEENLVLMTMSMFLSDLSIMTAITLHHLGGFFF